MSTVLFSKSFLGKITAIIRKFWWAGVQDNITTPIAYRSWDNICQPRENGGLGIRDLHMVNKSLIIQAAWNIATQKNPMLSVVLKAKYHPHSSFWTANTMTSKSIFWSSILQVKKDLISNVALQLHASNTSIWSAPWCQIQENIHDHILLPVTQRPLPATVSQLWQLDSQTWNINYMSNIFDNTTVQAITTVTMVPSEENDILRWILSKDGKCTTKNIYRHLSRQAIIQLPQQGPSSITQHTNLVMQKIWRSQNLPPLITTITWRLIRRALATGESASRYSNQIDNLCFVCTAVEDDACWYFLA